MTEQLTETIVDFATEHKKEILTCTAVTAGVVAGVALSLVVARKIYRKAKKARSEA